MRLVVRMTIMSSIDINRFIKKLNKKNFGHNIFMFAMGMLIMAIAFNLFFDRYNIIPTGSNGLSLLISELIPVDVSIVILVVGLICLMLGLIFFGYEYAFKMLLITLIYPFFVSSTTLITRFIDLEDTSLFLIIVVGGAMYGFATGLIRNSGYSPGGFCVLFDLIHKYFHISIGIATIIVNLLLIVASGFYFGIESAMYAFISLLISSYIVDRVTIGVSDNKVFYIVTDKPLEVKEYIYDKLHYEVTVVNARGGYTNKKKKMLMSVVSTLDYVKLKELVREIDKKAFFLILDAYESNVRKKL